MATNLHNSVQVLSDKTQDDQIKQLNPTRYSEILNARRSRYKSSFDLHMVNFPNLPLPSLQALQTDLTAAQNMGNESKINEINNKINNGEYAQGESLSYRTNYKNQVSSFVWPSAEELSIRQSEENELIGMLNQ